MFVGRKKYLEDLNQQIAKPSAAILVYGKRRVGKSTLIKESYKKSPKTKIYFECVKDTLAINCSLFVDELKRLKLINYNVQFSNFIDVFAFLNDQKKSFIVVIDEYPYLKEFNNQLKDLRVENLNTDVFGDDYGYYENIVFCNDLMAKIHDWMYKDENIEYRREDLVLCFFAYNGFINAPAHFDAAQNKYVANHQDVVMRDDVGVYYAVSSGFNYQKSFYDDASAVGRETYEKWVDIAPSTLLWTYNANFGSYLSHVNSTNFYNNDAYRAFAAGNGKLPCKIPLR